MPSLQQVIDDPTARLVELEFGSSHPISRAMYVTWLSRPDLQERFDLTTIEGRKGLSRWCRRGGDSLRTVAARVRRTYDQLAGSILDQRPRLSGCSLVGYSRGVLGMGEHVRMVAQSMSAAKVPFDVVDFSLGLSGTRKSKELGDHPNRRVRRRCTIMHVNADQMARAYWHFGPHFFEAHYIVGYWAWELERFPPTWHAVLGLVDELWAPSRFVQAALQPLTAKPVVYMPLCVELPPFAQLPRSSFGLTDQEFVFVFAFDCYSWLSRKNPAAIVTAFKQAFGRNEPVKLVLKAMHGQDDNPLWRSLVDMVGQDPRISLINEVWPRERLLGLIAAADAYVSLHRSEGFGRGPAEAMLLGKPVIATAYSGTQDFCGIDNCLPVGFELVEIQASEYPQGEGQFWARPDCDETASQMRRLFKDRDLAARLGAAGRLTISGQFCAGAIGQRYRSRLEQIGMLNEQEPK